MSTAPDFHTEDHGAHPPGDHGAAEALPHASLGGYLLGFGLSVLLTAVPFALVMGRLLANPTLIAVLLLAFAAVQIVVHMVFFLHLDARSEGGWNLLALLFTVALVVITLSGSLWVMVHMNANMMPDMHRMHEGP